MGKIDWIARAKAEFRKTEEEKIMALDWLQGETACTHKTKKESMDMKVDVSGQNGQMTRKEARYNWQVKDAPGVLMNLDKRAIRVNEEYQRAAHMNKVLGIASSWSWMAFGCLVIARRDGQYWAIDGMHRWLASMKRSDITTLPCIVFETENITSEARGFLDANTLRKPVTSHDKHKALLVVGDPATTLVEATLERLGMTLATTAKSPLYINAAYWCKRRASENPERFIRVMELAASLCKAESLPVKEMLLDGLWHLDTKIGLENQRLLDSIRSKGASLLISAAQKSAAHYGNRTARVLADGMLIEINRRLHHKFSLNNHPDE